MPKINKINHVAFVVDDMQKSLSFWRDTLGLQMTELRDNPAEQAQIAFLPIAGSEIELVRPTSKDSGLAKYLARHGPGMHHVCFETDDIQGMLAQLQARGVRLINETPRTGGDGRKYAFIHPESTGGVLVELYQFAVV